MAAFSPTFSTDQSELDVMLRKFKWNINIPKLILEGFIKSREINVLITLLDEINVALGSGTYELFWLKLDMRYDNRYYWMIYLISV